MTSSKKREQAAFDLKMFIGIYGMPWVLEVCAQVFDGIREETCNPSSLWEGYRNANATTRANVLRGLKRVFKG